MPTKPQSKAHVLETAARTFNEFGYCGTSMATIADACGTSKGMIYGHYPSKEELATAAFELAAAKTWSIIQPQVGAIDIPHQWLHAFIDAWDGLSEKPAMPGGCPLMKVATEAPAVRNLLGAKAKLTLDEWVGRLRLALVLLRDGGGGRPDLDPIAEAELILAGLEGGSLMARIRGDHACSHRVAAALHAHVDTLMDTPVRTE